VAIEREAVSRYIDVEAGVAGRSLGAVAGDVRARLAELSFPLEYHAEVLEATASEEIAATTMLAFAVVAAITAFLLLQAAFGSWRLAAITFLLLPAALVGGLAAAAVDGAELTLGSAIALLALLGLAARNTVLSVRHFQALEREQNGGFGSAQLRRGAQDRLAPVLTTAAAVALLALPFVVLGTRPGFEVVHAMAVVVLGGLVTTTLLALFVLPSVCARFAAAPAAPVRPEDVVVTQVPGTEIPGGVAPSRVNGPRLGAGDAPAGRVETRESER
jgi:Cu/Ag efflux pump CusA